MATHERIYERTPSGGDYSEIFYFDDEGNAVEPEKATNCVIRECTNDGRIINELFGECSPSTEES